MAMRSFYSILLILMLVQTASAQQPTIDAAVALLGRNQMDSALLLLRPLAIDSNALSLAQRVAVHGRLSDALLRSSMNAKGDGKSGISAPHLALVQEAYVNAMAARRLAKGDAALSKQADEPVRKLKLELTNITNKNLKSVNGAEDSLVQRTLLDRGEVVINCLLGLDSTFHIAYDNLAQTLMAKGDSAKALEVLAKGIVSYEYGQRAEPDLWALQMYPRLGRLQMAFLKDSLLAERTVVNALVRMDTEETMVKTSTTIVQKRKELMTEKINNVRAELKNLNLRLVMNTGQPTPEHVKQFTDALERNPNDLNLRLAYARILSRTHPEAGLRYYESLADIASDDFVVLYSVGALYSNRAAHYSLPENRDENELSRCLVSAFRWFEKAEIVEPDNRLVIEALAQITERLGQKSRSRYYRAKLEGL